MKHIRNFVKPLKILTLLLLYLQLESLAGKIGGGGGSKFISSPGCPVGKLLSSANFYHYEMIA